MDVTRLRLSDLKKELGRRGLDTAGGLKAELAERLQAALDEGGGGGGPEKMVGWERLPAAGKNGIHDNTDQGNMQGCQSFEHCNVKKEEECEYEQVVLDPELPGLQSDGIHDNTHQGNMQGCQSFEYCSVKNEDECEYERVILDPELPGLHSEMKSEFKQEEPDSDYNMTASSFNAPSSGYSGASPYDSSVSCHSVPFFGHGISDSPHSLRQQQGRKRPVEGSRSRGYYEHRDSNRGRFPQTPENNNADDSDDSLVAIKRSRRRCRIPEVMKDYLIAQAVTPPLDQNPSLEYSTLSTAKKAKRDSGRPFQEAWTVSFGVIERDGKALCLLCEKSIVSRTSSVRRHFETTHPSVAKLGEAEREAFLKGKFRKYCSQYLSYYDYLSTKNHLTVASFQMSLCIAEHGKAPSHGDIIKTAMLSGSHSLFHDFPNKDKIIQRISEVPLSRNTVKDRVQHMASDVSQQLTADLQKAAYYSMCLDESTDVNKCARLAVILRYPVDDSMREELVKLVSLPERTQGIDIYNTVMEVFLSRDIRPERVVSVSSDGSLSMVGATSGFIEFFVKETKHQVIQFPCIIHQEALCDKESSKKFDNVLKDVTQMVNDIMSRFLNFQQFQTLCEEVQAQYNCLLMNDNVRWLSRGRVLEKFVACLDEIRLFMNEKGQEYPQLTDTAWLTDLMFFTDFTLHFSVLNKQLQNVGRTAERMLCDIKTFEKKLQVFQRDLESGQLKYFPNLKMHVENYTAFEDNPASRQEIYKEFSSIVAAAKVNFSSRFLQFRQMETTLCFLTSPDKATFEELDLSCLDWLGLGNLEMELLEFQESFIWKNKFCGLRERLEKIERMTNDSTVSSENEILKVWNSLPNKFRSLKELGIAILTLFGSSYVCEQLFSALNSIKSDTRSRLTDGLSDACVALKLTKYEPRLDELAACIQQQESQ